MAQVTRYDLHTGEPVQGDDTDPRFIAGTILDPNLSIMRQMQANPGIATVPAHNSTTPQGAPAARAAPASPPVPWYQRPVIGFGSNDALVNLPPFNPTFDAHGIHFGPAAPAAPRTPPAPPPPPLNLGPPAISPSDQQNIEAIHGLADTVGPGTPPATPQLPPAPTYTADPGLELAATHAQDRSKQVAGLIGDLQAQLKQDSPDARGRWVRLGEFLSAVAANGHLEQAGAIMSGIMARDREMRRELRQESTRLTLQGFSVDDAAVQAQANLLSGQHAAAEHTTEAGYQRGVSQTGLEQQHQGMVFDAQARTADARTRVAEAEIQARADANVRAEARQHAGLTALSGDPTYGAEASTGLAAEAFPGNERAQGALSGVLGRQRAEQGLQAYILSNPRTNANEGQLLRLYREFDPTIRKEDLDNPQGLFFRLTGSANAEAAFARHPEFARMGAYQVVQPRNSPNSSIAPSP